MKTPSLIEEKLIQADRLLREKNFHEAVAAYESCLPLATNEKSTKRINTSINLCNTLLRKKKITPTSGNKPGSPAQNFLNAKAIELLKCKPQVFPGYPSRYPGDIINKSLALDELTLFSHFHASPWQTSLALCAALALRKRLGLALISDIAEEGAVSGNLLMANIMLAFFSPIGLQRLAELIKTSFQGEDTKEVNEQVFYLIYRNKYFNCDTLEAPSLEPMLRELASSVPRFILASRNQETHASKAIEIFAGSIFLNERKWLQRCLHTHYPLVDQWCLVEGACQGYPERKVSPTGLSKDYCWLALDLFPDPCGKITYIKHGWTRCRGEDAKSELRNQYIKRCQGKVLAVIDIDEFYPADSFHAAIAKVLQGYSGVVVPQVHFWKGTERFIIGGYYDVSHMRFFSIKPGMRYVSNHNFPELPGSRIRLDSIKKFKFNRDISCRESKPKWNGVYCFHMGFAKDNDDMKDKTEYYLNRGESSSRPLTTESRAAWFEEERLPNECSIFSYTQEALEVLES